MWYVRVRVWGSPQLARWDNVKALMEDADMKRGKKAMNIKGALAGSRLDPPRTWTCRLDIHFQTLPPLESFEPLAL